jgi:hypothetical protein
MYLAFPAPALMRLSLPVQPIIPIAGNGLDNLARRFQMGETPGQERLL